jgi:aconitate decarboxylase
LSSAHTADAAPAPVQLDATAQLIAHVHELRFEDLPARSVANAKIFIADTLGVALAGHLGGFAQRLIGSAGALGQANDARVWGTRTRLPAAHAAMVNAYLIHCLEFDCVHEPAVVHPMAVILATLVAYAERSAYAERRTPAQPWQHPGVNVPAKPVSGRDLLLAVVVAVDVAATLGSASRAKLRFFRPAQCGAFGAAAALAKLAGMDSAGIRNVLGGLLGQISGTMQAHREGVALLPMQIAFNARNALTAFDFARAGLVGPAHAFDGEFGYLPLFEGAFDLSASVSKLLSDVRMGEHAIDQVSHKPFPSGRATHGGLDALQMLMREHALTPTASVDKLIAKIELFAPPLIRQLIDRPAQNGASANYLRLCFSYCAACVMLNGSLSVLDFSDSSLRDIARFRLAERVFVHADDNIDVNALAPIRLRLTTSDGRSFERTVTDVLGSPKHRLSSAAQEDKLRANMRLFEQVELAPGVLRDAWSADHLVSAVNQLERASNISDWLDSIARR